MVRKRKESAAPLPDELRCNRSDGRQWRCPRRALNGNKLCEIHYLQGRHRQFKRKVPDSLKLERKRIKIKGQRNRSRKLNNGVENRASSSSRISKMPLMEKRKRCVSETLDEALKKMKLKRGDLQLELLRVYLQRQVEKKKEKELLENEKEESNGDDQNEAQELVLPYAVMAISTQNLDNAGSGLYVKLGSGADGSSSSILRHFRSKNIEPAPISTLEVVPYAEIVKKKRRSCHWCKESRHWSLIKCLNCRKKFFCVDCIKERYFEKQEIKVRCPVCRGVCSCSLCLTGQSKTTNHKEFYRERKKVDRIQLLQYLIHMLLPVLTQINREQSIELDMEAKKTEKYKSDFLVQQAETSNKKVYCCGNCKNSIVDYHRSCPSCSFNLCLSCCREFCRGNLQGEFLYGSSRRGFHLSDDEQHLKITHTRPRSRRMSVVSRRASQICEVHNGAISCPPPNWGGCGGHLLELRCIFPFYWTKDLEVSAEEILCSYKFSKPLQNAFCSLCKSVEYEAVAVELLPEVAKRVDSNENFLYRPTLRDLHEENLDHFQEHWSKGHPVIVRNVLPSTLDLTWDPVVLFCAYLDKSSASPNRNKSIKGTNCLDWCEIEISNKKTFIGSLEGQTHANMRRKEIKFNAWLSPQLYQEHFPAHFAESLQILPLQEYMNPTSGLLNLAVKLPGELLKPELGPCIFISYGGPEDFMQAESLTNLCYESCDVVNILAHATEDPISEEQLRRIKTLSKVRAQECRQSTNKSTDQKGKTYLPSEDTGESGLHDMNKEGVQFPNGISKVPFCSADLLNRQFSSVEDKNTSQDSEYESESDTDSENSILCSGIVEGSEDLEDKLIFEAYTERSSSSDEQVAGAQWDIFHRQDVPQLLDYLRRHSNELSSGYCYPKHIVHPVLDQIFFLDAFHKMRLKEEYGVQPWSFDQHPGEAVIIPAGCPYQIKKLKSCVNIVLDFISPESATECINLNDEIRLLPLRHKAKAKLLEVRTMTLHGINAAVNEIRDLMHAKTMDGQVE